MVDSVPTRLERVAAVIAVLSLVLLVPAAVVVHELVAVVVLFVVVTCASIAKARVGADALLTFGLDPVADDDPAAKRYRDRRERETERVREIVSMEYDPRLDRLLVLGLVVVGIGALVLVATTGGESARTGQLLVVALIALNGALVAYGAAHMQKRPDSDAETASDETN